MKVTLDPATDTLQVIFGHTAIDVSDEERADVIIDYDNDGNVVGLEILDASKRMDSPRRVEYALAV